MKSEKVLHHKLGASQLCKYVRWGCWRLEAHDFCFWILTFCNLLCVTEFKNPLLIFQKCNLNISVPGEFHLIQLKLHREVPAEFSTALSKRCGCGAVWRRIAVNGTQSSERQRRCSAAVPFTSMMIGTTRTRRDNDGAMLCSPFNKGFRPLIHRDTNFAEHALLSNWRKAASPSLSAFPSLIRNKVLTHSRSFTVPSIELSESWRPLRASSVRLDGLHPWK
jgi:hypothetical protein